MTPALSARPTPADWTRWGVDPSWSRLVRVRDHEWHVLEAGPENPIGTIVCVHGNPTWSYLWRSFLRQFGDRYRVIALDQLGMGYSQRTRQRRRYEQRVDDLDDVISALGINGPLVLAAHDWGGAIALGWAVRHPDRVHALVLTNTGIAVPAGLKVPPLISLAGSRLLNRLTCEFTSMFVRGTARLSGRRINRTVREAYRAPYVHARDRRAVAEFVDDVPFTHDRPSAAAIAEVAANLGVITAPVLLAWGSRDPVFSDEFSDDLALRLTGATVSRHRFPNASHLVVEENDVAGLADRWLHGAASGARLENATTIWAELDTHRSNGAVAFVHGGVQTTFAELVDRIERFATGLRAEGMMPGDRIALLVPPSVELVVAVYGCWRAGVVAVVADRGLGLRALGRAVRGCGVHMVITVSKAVPILRAVRAAPAAKVITTTGAAFQRIASASGPVPDEPSAEHPAAVLFTSGATGPAKGVTYTQGQLAAQRDALRATYGITSADRLVAAFAPFALYGPALGIASTIPDVDVTKPATLTADALAAACRAVGATIVFASPAALTNVVTTAGIHDRFANIRLVLSAGAPVPAAMLRRASRLFPGATLHTPYGMTEVLPVADIDLAEIDTVGVGHGVCVGHAVAGAEVVIEPGSNEVLIRAPWLSTGYDRLWQTEANARPTDADGRSWHRSGDVGHLDDDGRLWIEGRTAHVIHTADGAVTPVPIEVAVEQMLADTRVAATGVGPHGCQQAVVVVERPGVRPGLADAALTRQVREATSQTIAAVLVAPSLPVDIRHNAKIDRTLVGRWATSVLEGGAVKVSW